MGYVLIGVIAMILMYRYMQEKSLAISVVDLTVSFMFGIIVGFTSIIFVFMFYNCISLHSITKGIEAHFIMPISADGHYYDITEENKVCVMIEDVEGKYRIQMFDITEDNVVFTNGDMPVCTIEKESIDYKQCVAGAIFFPLPLKQEEYIHSVEIQIPIDTTKDSPIK